ncbi:MAG: hypothetical protein WCL57_08320 [Chloroflexota bacterium]|nr:hypothetical protein [Chloroflexota bacterium]
MKKSFTLTFKADVACELIQEEKTMAQIAINGLVSLYEDGQREIKQVKKQQQIEKE